MSEDREALRDAFRRWCRELEAPARGKLALANLRHDSRAHRLPSEVVSEFLQRVAERWKALKEEQARHEAEAADAGDDEVKEFPGPDRVWSQVATDLSLRGEPVREAGCACSRVMTAADFVNRNLRKREGIPVSAHPSRQDLRIIKDTGMAGLARGWMRTSRPFAWVTRASALDPIRNAADAADRARKRMGLLHYHEDERLVEVRYPASTFQPGDLRVPTAVEGCPSMIFRSRTADDGWGRTVDLESLDDGVPEALHPQVRFTDEFEFDDLGELPPLRLAWGSWDEFLATLPDGWSGDLVDELEAYV